MNKQKHRPSSIDIEMTAIKQTKNGGLFRSELMYFHYISNDLGNAGIPELAQRHQDRWTELNSAWAPEPALFSEKVH